MFRIPLLLSLAAPLAAQDLQPGLGLEAARVSPAVHQQLALAVTPDGRVLVGTEDAGLVEALDADGDGFYEAFELLDTGGLQRVQGICAEEETWWLVANGTVPGGQASGLWRVPAGGGAAELVLGFEGDEEHGPHGVVRGPDGALYVSHGDLGRPKGEPQAPRPALPPALLPPLPDPSGYAQRARWPYGGVVRVEPESGAWRWRAHGMRNPYDLVFDAEGECFTADADMEWDLGWCGYRPTKACLAVEGGDHGWRPGSDPLPHGLPDLVPPIAELGRGSPTGVLLTDTLAWPASYDDVLLIGDWSAGELIGVRLAPDGAGFKGTREVVLTASGSLPITDLAALPDGALLMSTGGRGQTGGLVRVAAVEPRDAGRAARPGADERAVRRDFEVPGAGPYETAVALARTEDPWMLRARRPHFPAHLRTTPTVAGVLDRNHWWPELKLVEPRFRDAQDGHDGVNFLWLHRIPDWLRIRQLRALVVVLAHGGRIDSRIGPNFENRLKQLLDSDQELIRRQAAELLGSRRTRYASRILVEALAAEEDREHAIHLARCLAACAGALNTEQRVAALAFLEQASTFGGNVSYAGWIQAMVDAHLEAARSGELVREAARGTLGPRTLAALLGRATKEDTPKLVEALRVQLEALLEDLDPAVAAARRAATLQALADPVDPSLAPWLRELLDAEPAVAAAALVRLAALGDPADASRMFDALTSARHEVRQAADRYWRGGVRHAPTAEQARALIGRARRLGGSRGLELYGHLARMLGEPDGDELATERARWEGWFRRTHPDAELPEPSPADGPAWGGEDLLAVVTASAERAGSSARGQRVFERAGCNACHGFGSNAVVVNGYGPDLTGVHRRFDLAGLLAAIEDPSRDVPEQWRASRAVVSDGARTEVIEGRLLRQDEREVVVLLPSGTERALPRAQVVEVQPIDASPMPEGLLDGLTVEDIRDLLAHLAADGVVTPTDAAGAPWTELLDMRQLKHWKGSMEGWALERGVLAGVARDLERNAYLVYDRRLGDFELEFDVWLDGGNSGVQYRSQVVEGKVDPVGYQADIGQRHWGSIYATDGRGKLGGPELLSMEAAIDRDGWNHYHLRVEGDQHRLEVNGVVLAELTDDAHTDGVLALQLHQGASMKVWFANLRARSVE